MDIKNKLELQRTNKSMALYFETTSGEYEWVDKKDPRVNEPRILDGYKTALQIGLFFYGTQS